MNFPLNWFEWFVELVQARPLLLLSLLPLPLFGVGAIWRIFPNTPLVMVSGVPVLLSFGIFGSDEIFWVILTVDLAVMGTALYDLLTLARGFTISVNRHTDRIASIGVKHEVVLEVSNLSKDSVVLWLRDDAPSEADPQPQQFALQLSGQTRHQITYTVKPNVRGVLKLHCVYLRFASFLGLWQRFTEISLESEINVYPNLKQLSEFAVLARTDRLSLIGVRRTRNIGQGNEFERLRDYSLDDNYKHIDWRSTARRNRITVKEFQANQSQRVVFLLDCGRMMVNTNGELCLLDHALNAILMLSYVALSRGDSVGLLAFSDRVHSYVAPRSGMAQMNRLLHSSFNRFPQMVESRYDEAFLYLARHCRRRSLVVLISNLIDEVNAAQVIDYLSTLSGRHLPLGVLLRDHQLFDAAEDAEGSPEKMYRAAAASEIIVWRHQVIADLQHRGVLALDVFPEQLAAPLVNRYLEIKARHLL